QGGAGVARRPVRRRLSASPAHAGLRIAGQRGSGRLWFLRGGCDGHDRPSEGRGRRRELGVRSVPTGRLGDRLGAAWCRSRRVQRGCLAGVVLALAGCEVGPDFSTPNAQVADKWLESGDHRVKHPGRDDTTWWKALNDPILDALIATAYRQNLTLQTAGVHVLEARAQLGAAIGELYPQQQQAS